MAFVRSCCRSPFLRFLSLSSVLSSFVLSSFLSSSTFFVSSHIVSFHLFVAHCVLLTVHLSVDVVVVIQCFVILLPLNPLPFLLSSSPLILSSFYTASTVLSTPPPVSPCLCLNTVTHTYIYIRTYCVKPSSPVSCRGPLSIQSTL